MAYCQEQGLQLDCNDERSPSKNETDLEALMEAIAGGDATAMLEDELEEDRDEPLLAPTWVLKPCRYSERAPFLLHCSAKKSSSAQQQV